MMLAAANDSFVDLLFKRRLQNGDVNDSTEKKIDSIVHASFISWNSLLKRDFSSPLFGYLAATSLVFQW